MFTESAYSIRRRKPTITRRILVTGAAGSIGETVVPLLRESTRTLVFATDVASYDRELDVTDRASVAHWVNVVQPTHILHLAGAKHAPEGETDPAETFRVNTIGTQNVLAEARKAKVILASTCKACDPETVYGASKLIAERMVLNAGGVVLRYFNVKETSGNVFRLWESVPADEPLPVTSCWRYFISKNDAARLTVASLDFKTGRYATDPGAAQYMFDVAEQQHPDRTLFVVPRRRGDREREPLCATSEKTARIPGTSFLRIVGYHDPA